MKDILQKSGIQAKKMVIYIDPKDQSFHMPIRFQKNNGTGLNLVPINYCIDSILEIIKNPVTEGIFHIINTQNTPLEDLINFTKRFLNLSGICVEGSSGQQGSTSGPLDIFFQRFIEPYQPYIEDTRAFDNTWVEQILDQAEIRCPAFSYPVFERCMTYALENNGGRTMDF